MPNERDLLERLRKSHTAPRRAVQRAEVLWLYHTGESIAAIMDAVHLTRKSVAKWVSKALQVGVAAGLQDTPAWQSSPADGRGQNLGGPFGLLETERLRLRRRALDAPALAQHVRREAVAAGHPSLARAGKATVHRILAAQPLQPHKVTYYLQRRDPAFESKMREVLLVYQEVALQNQSGEPALLPLKVVTVSVDERPGDQAIANTAPDLPPVPGKHPRVARDHEYKRLGTCSILAALDLHTGHVTGRVERRHRSREFIALLRDLDAYYPQDCTLRLVLDNHSAHLSKETQAYLASRPNRFKYVLTPTHGSWLNLAETLFGKMARTFLRHIRVHSWEELRDRILKGITEINSSPVVHRWKKFEGLTALTQ